MIAYKLQPSPLSEPDFYNVCFTVTRSIRCPFSYSKLRGSTSVLDPTFS